MTETIQALLSKVSTEIGAVGKNDRNTGQNFDFRGIDAVTNACAPILHKHGIISYPVLQSVEYVPVTIGRNATPATSVRVIVDYVFEASPEQRLVTRVAAEGNDAADKGTAKAMSVAMRIAFLQALGLPTDEPDPDSFYEEQQVLKPKHVQLQVQAIEVCKSKKISQADALAEFHAIGGTGKISECDDVILLAQFVDHLEAS